MLNETLVLKLRLNVFKENYVMENFSVEVHDLCVLGYYCVIRNLRIEVECQVLKENLWFKVNLHTEVTSNV